MEPKESLLKGVFSWVRETRRRCEAVIRVFIVVLGVRLLDKLLTVSSIDLSLSKIHLLLQFSFIRLIKLGLILILDKLSLMVIVI